jgi:hypothetical protein
MGTFATLCLPSGCIWKALDCSGIGVGVEVGDGVGVGVAVGRFVAVGVAVGCCVAVGVAVASGVGEWLGVGVDVEPVTDVAEGLAERSRVEVISGNFAEFT